MKDCTLKILNIVSCTMIVVCLIPLINAGYQKAIGVQQPMVFGWGQAIVLTGSMEPTIPTGSLILIQEQDQYLPGEIITYEDSTGRSITHRIVSIQDGMVVAKGDANNSEDTPFDQSSIIGKVMFVFPNVGKVLSVLTQPAVLSILFVLPFIYFLIAPIKQKKY